MKAAIKGLICISLSLMCLFACVGYAFVTGEVSVKGSVETTRPEGVYITNITDLTDYSTANIDKNEFEFVPVTTNIENTISRGEGSSVGVVEYEITVFNNTDITYYYRDIYFQPKLFGYNGNDYISEYSEDISVNIRCVFRNDTMEAKKLAPGKNIVFKVVYTVGEAIGSDIDLKMFINVRFGINVEGESEAVEAIEDRFLKILNTPDSYNYLLDVLDNKFDGEYLWTANYIGNVAGASESAFSEDSMIVNALFQNQLQMTIDGELKEATVLIKHESADGDYSTGDSYVVTHPSGVTMGDSACEMVLYLTIDSLDVPWGSATVYVMVFTCDSNNGEKLSDWYKIGSTFVGKAPIVDYVTGWEPGVGSVRSTDGRTDAATYDLIEGYHFEIENGNDIDTYHMDGYSYSLDQGLNLYSALEAWRTDSVPVMKELLRQAKQIVDNKKYAGEGINELSWIYEKYYWMYDYSGMLDNYKWPVCTVRKFTTAILDLYGAIDNALTNISNLP